MHSITVQKWRNMSWLDKRLFLHMCHWVWRHQLWRWCVQCFTITVAVTKASWAFGYHWSNSDWLKPRWRPYVYRFRWVFVEAVHERRQLYRRWQQVYVFLCCWVCWNIMRNRLGCYQSDQVHTHYYECSGFVQNVRCRYQLLYSVCMEVTKFVLLISVHGLNEYM